MTIPINGTTIEIFGKSYQIKCSESERESLQKAAKYLDEKMHEVRNQAPLLSLDLLALMAALNLSHQMLNLTNQKLASEQVINERLQALQKQLELSLANVELESAQ